MKYNVCWIESGKFKTCWSSRSLVKTFVEVYGVYNFRIHCKKFEIVGSHFISSQSDYDSKFHYLLDCFLTQKQKIKVYKLLCKTKKSFSKKRLAKQYRRLVKNQKILESNKRKDSSYNEYIKEYLNG